MNLGTDLIHLLKMTWDLLVVKRNMVWKVRRLFICIRDYHRDRKAWLNGQSKIEQPMLSDMIFAFL